ncbi:MAG: tetratricopeptide repeat protein [Anaerolineae bacterium]|nr:tetratricopeptide repeat protein [Anaerolineae bacterium]
MTDQPSYTQLVAQVLVAAPGPLTLDEIWAQVEPLRPVRTKNPRATLRGTITSLPLATTLGGRPARYTWWPNHLPGCTFRQPLSAADIASGSWVVNQETWLALWPDFSAGAQRSAGAVTLELAGGPILETRVIHLVPGKAVWGLPPTPALAAWYQQVAAQPGDAVFVRVVDVTARRYAVRLARQAEQDTKALAARDGELAAVAERLLRQGTRDLSGLYLVPRLIANDVYRDAVPPASWEQALRADLRFVVHSGWGVSLVAKLVRALEREGEVSRDPFAVPRPSGQWHQARSPAGRQAWAEYLFSRGLDYRWAGYQIADEAHYRAALQLDPGHADAWVHLGNRRFAEGLVREALADYRRGRAAAEARTIGDPAAYPAPFWSDLDSRPFMRALHGQGLCLWRLGQRAAARAVFARMLALNPNDNQGVRFLIPDLDAGLTWEESVAHEDEEAW